ncbi:hypothetical protein RKLH11_4012 [Rhodobacteraceae bacterium KLH11]|nr:hypothetical protein RKLH11_4012 [Rhodobacteraceae bacterium KLH11]
MILAGVAGFLLLGGQGFAPDLLRDLSFLFAEQEDGKNIRGGAWVIDGDTLVISGQRIRIAGIDAPELDQPCLTPSGMEWRCGDVARAALGRLVVGKTVECMGSGDDPFGRFIATCHVDGRDAGGWMVERGWAMAYREFSLAYVAREVQAREDQRGVWIGTMQPPWEWRAAQR